MANQPEHPLPDFFVAGAPRCGTTTLYRALQRHPAVFLSPVKEPHYFSRDDIDPALFRAGIRQALHAFDWPGYLARPDRPFLHRWYVRDRDQYRSLFRGSESCLRRGEASTSYLWSPHAADAIRAQIPAARIVIPLRHPVERAYSHYLMERRMGLTEKSFADHWAEDRSQPVRAWGAAPLYAENSLYSRGVKRFLDAFGTAQVKMVLLDDLRGDWSATMASVFGFLGVEAVDPGPQVLANQAALPRPWTTRLAARPWTRRLAGQMPAPVKALLKHAAYRRTGAQGPDAGLRAEMLKLFREDTLRLQELIGRNLPGWLE
jgi:hypothetical protein